MWKGCSWSSSEAYKDNWAQNDIITVLNKTSRVKFLEDKKRCLLQPWQLKKPFQKEVCTISLSVGDQLHSHSLPSSFFPVSHINLQHLQLPHLILLCCMFPQIFISRFSTPAEGYSLELPSMQCCCFSKFTVAKRLLVIPSAPAVHSLTISHQLAEAAPFFPLPFFPPLY